VLILRRRYLKWMGDRTGLAVLVLFYFHIPGLARNNILRMCMAAVSSDKCMGR
jgi:hypothetical protein